MVNTSEDCQDRMLWRVEHLRKRLEFLGHEEAARLGHVALAQHGRVGAVRRAKGIVDVDCKQRYMRRLRKQR